MFRLLIFGIIFCLVCPALLAQTTNTDAPGAPGVDAHWSSAAKNGVGTSNSLASKVWFTLNNGVLTEVYYPRLDVPNVQALQLLIVGDKVETESDDTLHRLEVIDNRSLSFRQINIAKNGDYEIRKTYATDPRRSSLLIQIDFQSRGPHELFVYYDPSLNNSGMHDTAWTEGDAMLAVDGDKASALISSSGFAVASNGYSGKSDGLTELRRHWSGFETYQRAVNGNVVQVGALNGFALAAKGARITLALGFGKTAREALDNARASLARGFENVRREYEAGWHDYLRPVARVDQKYQPQFNFAALTLKALEDKTYRGALIASPSVPWGGGANANEPTTSGYHAVWARDLYHVASAFIALGDRPSANRALDFLFKVQQKADGSFPQNSWVDGRPIGDGLQMDQVAMPLVLAYQLHRNDRQTWLKHIKPAADFIVRKGPGTEQERWEEERGYSPSTIAAEIAGLVCAAQIAVINRDQPSAIVYLRTADAWRAKVDGWTATRGPRGDRGEGHYYLRITENDNPDDGAKLEINSSSRVIDERAIIDAGFVELVRLGVKPANDPLIAESLVLIDQLIKVETPGGSGWYRYNQDAYGERPDGGNYDGRTGVGRLWTLLTGERGEYDVARGDLASARRRLETMIAFANDGMMIPEQVWDRPESPRPELRFGEGTGSATPLAWSMAQFVRLAINIKQGHNVETPKVTLARYVPNP